MARDDATARRAASRARRAPRRARATARDRRSRSSRATHRRRVIRSAIESIASQTRDAEPANGRSIDRSIDRQH